MPAEQENEPTRTVLIFDACAVIALLDDEEGSETVSALLRQEDRQCLVHVVNACEVYYHVYRSGGEARAAQLESILASYGFTLDDSLSSELWHEAGRLKAQWRRVSLADCFALALTIQEKGTLVTSDHHELDRIAQANICPIRFIR